ncbi:hypothetical protein [Archangium sp.]|uniref:hypothetical protein n=1 Tax=Archangium sp. TaxID=1872627 RepID=UPI00389B2571
MRKPNWLDLGIAVLGLFLVCGAAQGMAQTAQYGGTSGGTGTPAPSPEDSSVGDVTQDSRITGTSDGMGSSSGLVTDDTPQETGTGGAGTAGQAAGGPETAGETEQGPDTETDSQPASVDGAQQRLQVARLRTEVARLEQQLAQMRAQLSAAESGVGGSGVGGSGSAGLGDANAEAPPGAARGIGDTSAEGVGGGGGTGTSSGRGTSSGSTASRAPDNRPDTSNQGYAEAVVIYTGRIRSVTAQRLVLEDSGLLNTMPVASNVRVLNGGKQVSLQSLRDGTSVRVSADMYAKGNPVTEIQVLPPTAR